MMLAVIFAALLGIGAGVAIMYAALEKARDDASEVRMKYIWALHWILHMPDSCITKEYVEYLHLLSTKILGDEDDTEQEETQ